MHAATRAKQFGARTHRQPAGSLDECAQPVLIEMRRQRSAGLGHVQKLVRVNPERGFHRLRSERSRKVGSHSAQLSRGRRIETLAGTARDERKSPAHQQVAVERRVSGFVQEPEHRIDARPRDLNRVDRRERPAQEGIGAPAGGPGATCGREEQLGTALKVHDRLDRLGRSVECGFTSRVGPGVGEIEVSVCAVGRMAQRCGAANRSGRKGRGNRALEPLCEGRERRAALRRGANAFCERSRAPEQPARQPGRECGNRRRCRLGIELRCNLESLLMQIMRKPVRRRRQASGR